MTFSMPGKSFAIYRADQDFICIILNQNHTYDTLCQQPTGYAMVSLLIKSYSLWVIVHESL